MSEIPKIKHFHRLFDEYELRGGEGFTFAEWLAEIKVPKLEAENEALRKLAHDYITAYEKLAFGDALLTGESDGQTNITLKLLPARHGRKGKDATRTNPGLPQGQ